MDDRIVTMLSLIHIALSLPNPHRHVVTHPWFISILEVDCPASQAELEVQRRLYEEHETVHIDGEQMHGGIYQLLIWQ